MLTDLQLLMLLITSAMYVLKIYRIFEFYELTFGVNKYESVLQTIPSIAHPFSVS